MPSRRTVLRTVGTGSLAGLAGCTNESPAADDAGPDAPTESTSTDGAADPAPAERSTTARGLAVPISVWNRNQSDATLSLIVRRSGETVYDERVVVRGGRQADVDFEIVAPGTYSVSASLGKDTSATHEWSVPAGYDGSLRLVVTEGRSLDFDENLRDQPCEDGDTAGLPYAVPGAEETFQPGSLVIENEAGEARTVAVSIAHGERTFFECTYDLGPEQEVVVGEVTATAGDYRVVVDVANGGRTSYTWRVPPRHNWPQLLARVTESGDPIVGCGGYDSTRVTVENPTDRERTVVLGLSRAGEPVADRRITRSPGSSAEVTLPIPVGDFYVLTAGSAGGEASAEIVECYCFDQYETVVTLGADGPTIDSSQKVCE